MRVTTSFCLALALASPLWGQATYLDQGWDSEQREEFYTTAQGSQLIPFKWFLELEQSGSQKLLRDDDSIRKYGFLPSGKSERNPHGLPIGFVLDGVDPADSIEGRPSTLESAIASSTRFEVKEAYLGEDFDEELYPKEREAWFGLTCAACHTHDIEYGGETLRIDGGASQADIESFLRNLGIALDATWKDPGKLVRFAKNVRGDATNIGDFKVEVRQIANAVNRLVSRNKAKHAYGFARLDAFGAILNGVCETALGEPTNHRESNAPVSYPSLWNTTKMSFVQWNASAENPEGRNVGEVLGVFGTYTIDDGPDRFDSTVRLASLIKLEHELISKLQTPVWPTQILGLLDLAKVGRGRELFANNCVSCHAIRGADGNFVLNAQDRIPIRSSTVAEVRTDRQFMDNFFQNAKTAGLRDLFRGADEVLRPVMLRTVVGAVIQNRMQTEGVVPPPSPSGQVLPNPSVQVPVT